MEVDPQRSPGISTVEAIVDALSEAGFAGDSARRALLIQLVSDALRQPLTIPDQATGRDHLIQIITGCVQTPGAMVALTRAIEVMRPDSLTFHRVRALVEQPRVLDVLPEPELRWLRDRLSGTAIPRLAVVVRRAAGTSAHPAWQGSEVDTEQALAYLADVNAGPDGVPPLMRFAEIAADVLGGEFRKDLTAWSDRLAHRLNLVRELQEIRRSSRATGTSSAALHLVITIRHDAIDTQRYLVSYWRQDDPDEWPPPCGGATSAAYADLESVVDEIVTASEIAWADRAGAAVLEFVLPRSLLNLPVHLWCKEYSSGDPRPLCLDYPIAVRSLERMRNAQWHRVWRRRWQELLIDPASARVHFARPEDSHGPHVLDALLIDPRWALMVLSAPPAAAAVPGADELTAALRCGLPALIWALDGGSGEALHGAVATLVKSGLRDLPARVHEARQGIFLSSVANTDLNVVRNLVVLWDDPGRLITVD